MPGSPRYTTFDTVGTNPSLWPRVTSKTAKRMVQAAFDNSPLPDVNRPNEDYMGPYADLTSKEYQREIHDGLLRSDLAQRLAYGMDMLPDIYERMPFILRSLELLRRPRNMEQQVQHICRYLDWYLDHGNEHTLTAKANSANRAAWSTVCIVLLIHLLLAYVFFSQHAPSTEYLWFLPILIVLAFFFPLNLGNHQINTAQNQSSRNFDKNAINAIEFYFYIKDALADPPETGQDATNAREIEETLEELAERIECQ